MAFSRRKRRRAQVPDGLAVKRSATGLGLFALRPFPKGARIIEYVGRTISADEAYTSRSKYLFEISSRRTIDGKPRRNPAGYINHSCRPNCIPEIVRGRIFIEALRPIKAGEELGYDYGGEYFDEHIKPIGCRCHACGPRP